METIEDLMQAGNDLFSRVTIPGEPDWQGEATNIPDDSYPDEEIGDQGSGIVDEDEDDEELAAKLAGLLGIDDDAVFAKELKTLTESLQ